jgi:hypothetical protein
MASDYLWRDTKFLCIYCNFAVYAINWALAGLTSIEPTGSAKVPGSKQATLKRCARAICFLRLLSTIPMARKFGR